jgi:phosphate transport system protein
MELRIEEEVLKILSLYGPTARDLRFVVGVHKITNDLERVGDLAVNIAERAETREGREDDQGLAELGAMSERVREMLNSVLDAFVGQDRARAREVLKMDDGVDDLLRETYEQQGALMASGKGDFESSLRILSVAKHLERIADHCTNIAEDVIYMVSGDVVKHLH